MMNKTPNKTRNKTTTTTKTTRKSDTLQRFIFDKKPVKGALVSLDQTYQAVLERHDYPPNIRYLLGELMAASALLSATIKFEGSLSIQAQGTNALKMLMAQCTHTGQIRAIASMTGNPSGDCLQTLLGEGRLAITIEPDKGTRYQGIVPLENKTLAPCLEDYFRRSEQINTGIWLTANQESAGGMLLQALPEKTPCQEDWDSAYVIAASVRNEELLGLDNRMLLHRLFHEDDIRLYDHTPLCFGCTCSRVRTINALRAFPRDELEALLKEEGELKIDCQFCNKSYVFDSIDTAMLWQDTHPAPAKPQ